MTKSQPFAWFDLTRLRKDQTYPTYLSTQLGWPESDKLALILNDCVEILLAERSGIKDYKNKRKRHFNEEVLNDLPNLANKIKKLCQSFPIETCVREEVFAWPSKDQQIALRKIFPLEIDMLDLVSLQILNYLDEAFAQSTTGERNELEEKIFFLRLQIHWQKLKEIEIEYSFGTKIKLVELKRDDRLSKENQAGAGRSAAAVNRMKVVDDDIYIANIFLLLINHENFRMKAHDSLNKAAAYFYMIISNCLEEVPLSSQVKITSIPKSRVSDVIKEINHVSPELLIRTVLGKQFPLITRPIPTISEEKSSWRFYKIVSRFDPETNLLRLYREL